MITLKQIKAYVEGYGRLYYDLIVGLPLHQKEQVDYRLYKCKDDCGITKQCIVCGCDFPGKAFVAKSCNPERFPDFMNSRDWEVYKKNNNIV